MNISVCIPTYNQAPFIEKAILSVANQKQVPCEIIVYDDCSTDETAEILKKLSTIIPFLKVYSSSTNRGIAYNVNECLRAARGELIVRLDSDDYLHEDYILLLAKAFDQHPHAGYAHVAIQEVDKDGFFLNTRLLNRSTEYQHPDIALRTAAKGYKVAANILMFRRTALQKVNYLDNRPDFGEDFHLATAISAAGFGNIYLSSVLAYYRVWVDIGHQRKKRKLAEIKGLRSVFDEVIQPAFTSRKWSIEMVLKNRTEFACTQSDCLSWNVYSNEEKKELLAELIKLSDSRKAKIYRWIFLNGMGTLLTAKSGIETYLRKKIKQIIIHRRQLSNT